jgi:hypothetical protein
MLQPTAPARGAGAWVVSTWPVWGVLAPGLRRVVRGHHEQRSSIGPPSVHAKQPRSDSIVWSTRLPSATRTQRLPPTSAHQAAPLGVEAVCTALDITPTCWPFEASWLVCRSASRCLAGHGRERRPGSRAPKAGRRRCEADAQARRSRNRRADVTAAAGDDGSLALEQHTRTSRSACPLAEHLPQFGGEGVRIAGLAILAAQEASMVAREDHRRRSKSLGNRMRPAVG